MGFYSGNSGSIQFGKWDGDPDAEDFRDELPIKITSWTMNSSVNLLETTTLSMWDKSSEYGIRTHTGTLSLLYYSDGDPQESTPGNNAASWLVGALTVAETNKAPMPRYLYTDMGEWERSNSSIPVRLRLYLRRVSDQYRDFVDFNANLTSVSYASTVNEVSKVEVAFEANGQLRRNGI